MERWNGGIVEWWNVQMTTLYRYFLLIAHALYVKTTLKQLRKFSEQLLLLLLELAPLGHTWWLGTWLSAGEIGRGTRGSKCLGYAVYYII